jgi:hypothetical protein
MTRDQVEKEIADRELLVNVLRATEDLESMQADPDFCGPVDLAFNDRSDKKGLVAWALNLPPELAIVMLKAASAALEEQLQMEKV